MDWFVTLVRTKLKSNKYIRWIFRPSVRSFSTKCSALGFLNTSQCLVMGMAFFQLTNANTQYYFSEYLLQSEGNKTVQHASFFIPSSMFITPGFAKISIRIDSFILLWWKRESNAKNDTWSHPITWSGFCFKCNGGVWYMIKSNSCNSEWNLVLKKFIARIDCE